MDFDNGSASKECTTTISEANVKYKTLVLGNVDGINKRLSNYEKCSQVLSTCLKLTSRLHPDSSYAENLQACRKENWLNTIPKDKY